MNKKGSIMSKELKSELIGDLDWSPENRQESIQRIYRYVCNHAEQAINWYLIKKNAKRRWARILRLWAIIFAAAAALVPLLAQIYQNHARFHVDPVWASVALFIAATLVGLDRFFGFSSSWMRFITAELKIKTKYEAFQMDWQIKLAALKGEHPNDQQTNDLLESCKAFLISVNEIIVEEMEEWKRDFKSALKKIDAEIKVDKKV
jgi:hypothetical protein